MKWRNHSVLAFSTSLLFGYPLSISVLSAALSNLPDQIEEVAGIRVARHRGISHNLALWLIVYAVLALLPPGNALWKLLRFFQELDRALLHSCPPCGPEVLAAGPVFHLLGDMLTPGGVKLFKWKASFYLFKTGSRMEYVFTYSASLLFVLLSLVLPINPSPISIPAFSLILFLIASRRGRH